jgi:arsenite methyltransferase
MNLPTENICASTPESIFDRCSWFYALCRERLFADHTQAISKAMLSLLRQEYRPLLLEVGCGPGFYSLRLAKLFPKFDVIGLDPSDQLLAIARRKVEKRGLGNCHFVRARAQQLSDFPSSADFIIASRLFLILSNRRPALEGMYAALRPNGLLFIAEPLSPLRAMLPLAVMRGLQLLTSFQNGGNLFEQCCVLDKTQFATLVASLPWKRVEHWSDQRYQYALCEKIS